MLEDYGVDLVLTGHSHAYERSILLDGHYGDLGHLDPADARRRRRRRAELLGDGAYTKPAGASSHQGAVYVVAGTAGWTGGGSLDHPVMEVSLAALGSFVLDVQGKVLEGRFIDTQGKVVDGFTIAKCPEPDLALTGVTVDEAREEERCHAIAAGPGVVVAPGGNLVLRAGTRVELRDGFSVAAGGRLTIAVDPALADPP